MQHREVDILFWSKTEKFEGILSNMLLYCVLVLAYLIGLHVTRISLKKIAEAVNWNEVTI